IGRLEVLAVCDGQEIWGKGSSECREKWNEYLVYFGEEIPGVLGPEAPGSDPSRKCRRGCVRGVAVAATALPSPCRDERNRTARRGRSRARRTTSRADTDWPEVDGAMRRR